MDHTKRSLGPFVASESEILTQSLKIGLGCSELQYSHSLNQYFTTFCAHAKI